jgi:predicted Zn-dependent protease
MRLANLRSSTSQFLAITAALSLCACVAPTTDNPSVSQGEWQQEMHLQEVAAQKAPIDFNEKKPYGKNQVAALASRLAPIASRVEHASANLCQSIFMPNKVCQFKVILDAHERGLNAHADGQNVVIYPAMIDFARNDNHLAFVIAHEFAHNIMQHVAATQNNVTIGALLGTMADVAAGAAGANTQGVFSKVGSQQGMLRYSSAFEAEADYVGLYILARAGYKIEEAPDFWRIMSQAQPDAIYVSSSHPNNPARTIAMTKTVAEIRAKQRAGQPLIPNIRQRDS